MRIKKSLAKKYPWLAEPEIPSCDIQEAVNESEFWLSIHSCILYGLMTGNHEMINVDQCLLVLKLGEAKGVLPEKGYISPNFTLKK